MSTVRTALIKLAAVGAGAALVGGGAVHVAQKMREGKPEYVKHPKVVKHVVIRHKPRLVHQVITCEKPFILTPDKMACQLVCDPPAQVSGDGKACLVPEVRMAAVPLPPPPVPAASPTAGPLIAPGEADHPVRVADNGGWGGWGGGYFGSFFGLGGGGVIVVSSGGSTGSGGTSTTTTTSTTTGGGSSTTSSSTGGSTSTSSSTSTSGRSSGATSTRSG
ncbi:MAG: hypothetical protein JSS36_10340, partial [Proteobacteria bacterium]|nr:hypothetical protein [Pseudomonadota bacterium]